MMENSKQILELKERLAEIDPLEEEPDFFNSDETYVIFYTITCTFICIYGLWSCSVLITSKFVEKYFVESVVLQVSKT